MVSDDGTLMVAPKYVYNAKIISVYDGDTVTAIVDLGFGVSKVETLRFSRINTPELRGEEREDGLKSRDWLRDRILGKEVIVKTIKDKKGKYGRYIAEVYLEGENVNDELVRLGLAEYKTY